MTTIEKGLDPRDKPEDDGYVLPGMGMAETKRLIGISLEGSVG